LGWRVWVPARSAVVKPWRTSVIAVVHPTLFKVMLRFSAISGRIFAEYPVMILEPVTGASMITNVTDRSRLRSIVPPRPKAVLFVAETRPPRAASPTATPC
jgi:hypothetical protein